MKAPRITIIILNWNGWRDTLECLQSVHKINYPNFDYLVVDNASTDGSVAQLRQAFPDAPILETDKNLGYAGGNNAGIAHALKAQPEFILLLNNDTIVDGEILNAFVEAADRFPKAGMFGAKMYYYSQPETIWALGGGMWDADRVFFSHVAQDQLDRDCVHKDIFAIDYVIGCALFCRSDMIRDIGMMEEAFFLNFEEMDWCFRARKGGYGLYAVPGAKLWHKISASFGGEQSPLRMYFIVRNELLWARRHLPPRERMKVARNILRDLLPWFSLRGAGEHGLLRRFYWECKRYLGELNARRGQPYYQAQLYGILDYLRGRFGDCPSDLRAKLTARSK